MASVDVFDGDHAVGFGASGQAGQAALVQKLEGADERVRRVILFLRAFLARERPELSEEARAVLRRTEIRRKVDQPVRVGELHGLGQLVHTIALVLDRRERHAVNAAPVAHVRRPGRLLADVAVEAERHDTPIPHRQHHRKQLVRIGEAPTDGLGHVVAPGRRAEEQLHDGRRVALALARQIRVAVDHAPRVGRHVVPLLVVFALEDEALDRLAPFAQRVDAPEMRVLVAERLEHLHVVRVDEGVVPVRGAEDGHVLAGKVYEARLQPVLLRNGVEGQEDLPVVWAFAAQAQVHLLELLRLQLGGFFDPDGRDARDRLELFGVVQAAGDDLRAVQATDGHFGFIEGKEPPQAARDDQILEQPETRMADRPGHFAHDQDAVSASLQQPQDQFLRGEVRLAAARAAVEHEVAVPALQRRQVGLVDVQVDFSRQHLQVGRCARARSVRAARCVRFPGARRSRACGRAS